MKRAEPRRAETMPTTPPATAAALGTTIAALAFAAFSIGHVLERFVIRALDQQLDAQASLASAST